MPGAFSCIIILSVLAVRCALTGQSSRLAWCTAKTSHPAPQQRHLSSCQDSSFYLEPFSKFHIWLLKKKKSKPQSEKENGKREEMLNFFQVYGHNVNSWRQHDAAMWGLVALYPQRSKALSHSSDIFISQCEPTVGIYNFSNSTSLWGKTRQKRNHKGSSSLCS